MTIEEMKEEKRKAERAMADALNQFTDATGMQIDSVCVDCVDVDIVTFKPGKGVKQIPMIDIRVRL